MTAPIDIQKMIEDFGGVAALRRKLEARGVEISRKGIEKWRERGRLPDVETFFLLGEMAREEGFELERRKASQPE